MTYEVNGSEKEILPSIKDSASSHAKASAPIPPKFALIATFERIPITGKSCPRTSSKAIPGHGLVTATFV
jgi:hypothetical protein